MEACPAKRIAIENTQTSNSQEKDENQACALNTDTTYIPYGSLEVSGSLVGIPKSIIERIISEEKSAKSTKKLCVKDVFFINISMPPKIYKRDGNYQLNLSGMQLSNAECLGAYDISCLHALDLSGNCLLNDQFHFDIPSSLREMNLSNNFLTELPLTIKNSCLVNLNLSLNKFHAIPSGLPNSLTALDMSQNEIEEISSSELPNSLVVLKLSNNRIKKIPDTLLDSLTNLVYLDVSKNYLMNSFLTIRNRYSLSILDISNSGIDHKKLKIHTKELKVIK